MKMRTRRPARAVMGTKMNKTMKITTKPQNQQSQLQGGHVSHKTPDGIFMFSKSTPPVCQNQRNQIKRKQKAMMVRRKTPPPSTKNKEIKPKTAQESNKDKSLTEATMKIRSLKQERKNVQENDNNLSTIKRKRKFVHEYVRGCPYITLVLL